MSTLTVSVATISEITPHSNADRLELATVLGWQCAVLKSKYKEGDKVIYVPPDSLVPDKLAEKLNIASYLAKGRVKQIRLRGEKSFGLILDMPEEYSHWKVGYNCAEHFGIKKYEPPIRLGTNSGKARREHPLFNRYTDIENMRNYPNIFQDGEEVIATEKLHGTNSRIGIVNNEKMAGSKKVQRKAPAKYNQDIWYKKIWHTIKELWTNRGKRKISTSSVVLYWNPFEDDNIRKMLEVLSKKHKQVILYGEIIGQGIQKYLTYDYRTKSGYRAFDLLIDGKYINYDDMIRLCNKYNVETVPLIYRGPFSLEKIREVSEGNTLLNGTHIREGVVVKPIGERHNKACGRVILKYVSDDYLFMKEKKKDSDYAEI